jgi:hypothetical protein
VQAFWGIIGVQDGYPKVNLGSANYIQWVFGLVSSLGRDLFCLSGGVISGPWWHWSLIAIGFAWVMGSEW